MKNYDFTFDVKLGGERVQNSGTRWTRRGFMKSLCVFLGKTLILTLASHQTYQENFVQQEETL